MYANEGTREPYGSHIDRRNASGRSLGTCWAINSDGYRRRKQDGRYVVNTGRSKTITVFSRYFLVFPVFLGILQDRMAVYASGLSRCLVDIPDNCVRFMYRSLYLVPCTVQRYTGHRNTPSTRYTVQYVFRIWVGYPFSVWCMRVAWPQHHGPRPPQQSRKWDKGDENYFLFHSTPLYSVVVNEVHNVYLVKQKTR